jgi:hypothetical protein
VSIFSQGLCISPSHVLGRKLYTRITVWEIFKRLDTPLLSF